MARTDRDRLAREMLSSAVAGPTWSELDPPVLEGPALAGVRAVVDLFCSLLADDAVGEQLARKAVRDSITQHHRLGLQASLVVEAALAHSELLWDALVDHLDPSQHHALLSAAAETLTVADVLLDIASPPEPDRVKGIETRSREFLDRLLDPDAGDPTAAQAQAIGFRPAARYRAVAAVTGAARQPRLGLAIAIELRQRGGLAVMREDGVIGVLPEGAPEVRVGDQPTVAISEPVTRDRLELEIEFVTLFARVARELGRRGEVAADDLLTERLLLRSRPLIDQVRRRVIDPLTVTGQRTELVGTLVAYVDANFDRRVAAGVLHVHPGSLPYRLRLIEEATGLHFDRSDDVVLLTLAARAQQLASIVS